MKLCWLLTTYHMLLQLIDVPHWFLINMFPHVGFSRCLQALLHWSGFHAARGESEWCILLWRLAAQTVAARHLSSCWRLLLSSTSRVRKSAELLWHKTPDFTSDVASQQSRPQFCILQINESFRNAFVRNSKGCQTSPMRCDILLTEWHVIFHKVEGRVEAPIRIGGQLRYSSVANLLQSVCQKISKI